MYESGTLALSAGAMVSALATVDWMIIAGFIALSIGIGIYLSKRARKSTKDYFGSGGALPWWLLGTSMVATTFAADTPLTLAGWVVTSGISQNWFWWCQVLIHVGGVYFFARLWRRTQVLTDMEFVYLRYSGSSANALRGFKALWLAIPYGCIVMGWVNKAMAKIASLSIPLIPRVPGVDRVLELIYLNTPISSGLDAEVKAAIKAGEIDPYMVYEQAHSLGSTVDVEELPRLGSYIEKGIEQAKIVDTFKLDGFMQAFSDAGQALAGFDPIVALQGCGTFVQGVHELKILFFLFFVTIVYTMISGLWGVVVTDFIQFWIAMAGTILLAFLAVKVAGQGDGMTGVFNRMSDIYGADTARGMVGIMPVKEAGELSLMPFFYFWIFIMMAWWSMGFTDGGSYLAQRMLSAKDERHAALGYLWYSVAHYALRMWPWLIVGIVAAVMFPYVQDPLTGEMPGGEIAENGYVKVMITVLPAGLLGLLIASFFSAYMSTISTQVNLAASYILNDFYRPFIRKDATEKHYVRMSMLATIAIAFIGIVISLYINTISDAWFLIAAFNSGIGVIYIMRWYWWRVNAWTEIACIVTLIYLVIVFKVMNVNFGMPALNYPVNLLLTVPISFGFAMVVTLMTKPVEHEKLKEFYRRVQPGGPGWKHIEDEIKQENPEFKPKSPLTMQNFKVYLLSVATVYCFLFGIGKTVIGNTLYPDPVFNLAHVALILFIAGGYFFMFGVPGRTTREGGFGLMLGCVGAALVLLILYMMIEPLQKVGLYNRGFGILLIFIGLGLGWMVAQSFSTKRWVV